MIERKVLIPIVISCFSLAISFMTFYLSHLRSAHIQIDSGEYIDIYYFTLDTLGITLQISIVNHGAQLATIRKLALLIQSPGSSEGYLLEPRWYQRIDQDGNFLYDSLPVPIAVASRQNVTKQVLFRSSLDRPKEFQLTKPGVYNMTVLGWITD